MIRRTNDYCVLKKIPTLTDKELKRFWSKVDIGTTTECWNWTRYLDKDGYGQFSISRDNKEYLYKPNRIALMLKTGFEDIVARHTCDNPSCCNPNHLIWGSYGDNTQDMMDRNRNVTSLGSRHGMSKLNEELVLEIRLKHSQGVKNSELARQYGVNPPNITSIVKRQTWKHI